MRSLRFRLRLAAAALVAAGVVAAVQAPSGQAAESSAHFLADRFQLDVTVDSVHVIDEETAPLGLGYQPVVFLGSTPRAPRDLYRAELRRTPDGHPIAARRLANLTRTSAGDEDQLVVDGHRVATRTRVGDRYTAITLVDLSGESEEIRRGRDGMWRLLWRARNLIEFGTAEGVQRHSYRLLEPADEVALSLDGDGLSLRFDDNSAATGEGWRLTSGEELIDHLPPTRVQMALVPFTVDTVRLISWIGPRGIEWMEHVFFAGLDLGRRGLDQVGAHDVSGEEMAQEMATADDPPMPTEIDLADLPDLGFPPESLEPIRDDPLEGEGQWRLMTDERFVRLNPDAPPFFATTFLRPDPGRSFARAFIVIWDPRQVELYPVAGTVEPMSATGARGSGLVPRDEVDRMVAGFNGGFQATHGEYGMMMEGTLFIPPKGYGATVATLADGRTGMGTWNEEVDVIPPQIAAFRQNMTPLVHNSEVNPYNRDWWGAAPPGSRDPTYTQRSGVCLTDEGFVAYLWGTSLSPESLGEAMLRLGCVHGTHLDMNAILTGFEFYHVASEGELPELERELDVPFEGEDVVPLRDDLVYRSRRLARGMKHMNFPRYIKRDTRDFFWLKLRHVLPGAALDLVLDPALEGEGQWRVEGLPVGGFPPAFARTFLRPDRAREEERVELVRIDPRVVRGALGRSGSWPRIGPSKQVTERGLLAALITGAEASLVEGQAAPGDLSLSLVGSELVRPAAMVAAEVPEDARETMVALSGPRLSKVSEAHLAVGIDEQGMLVAALDPQGDAKLIGVALRSAGVSPSEAIALTDPAADLVFFASSSEGGEDTRAATLSGREPPEVGSADALLLLDAHVPQAIEIFPDVPVVRRAQWLRFHNKREVYLRSPDGEYRHVTGQDLPHAVEMNLRRKRR